MKFPRTLLLFSSLFTAALGVCSEEESKDSFKPDTHKELSPNSNYYLTLGTSLYYQNAGIGYRSRNPSREGANDYSLNLKYFPVKYIDKHGYHFWKNKYRLYPSFQYMRLMYNEERQPSEFRKYFGIGLELIAIRQSDYFIPIPNFKMSWGKAHMYGNFSQMSMNLGPALVDVYYIINAKRSKPWNDRFFLTSLSMTFEYSFGF